MLKYVCPGNASNYMCGCRKYVLYGPGMNIHDDVYSIDHTRACLPKHVLGCVHMLPPLPVEKCICPYRVDLVEDEIHFLISCDRYFEPFSEYKTTTFRKDTCSILTPSVHHGVR